MSVRRWVSETWREPAALVVVAALVAAIAFTNVAATVGELALAGAAGVALWHLHQRWNWTITPQRARWIAIGVVALFAFITFRPVLFHPTHWATWDGACQDAVLTDALPQLRKWEWPHWNHTVVGGDSSFELYPAFTYLIAGAITILTGADDKVPAVLVILAVIAHCLIAINATRLALRFVPAPVAAVIGCALILDQGAISAGGAVGTIQFSLLHSALGQVFQLFAIICVVDSLARPRLRTSIGIWVFTALAVITHPASLLATAIAILGLVMVALLARDVPARRPLFAVGHLAVGTLLGAFVWAPLGARLLQYTQHFSNILVEPAQWLVDTFGRAIPEGSFGIIVFMAYAGIVAGMWSRRATPVLLASIALACLFARSDVPYLAFDVAPSTTVARLGADRFYGLVRPFSYVLGAYTMTLVYRQVRSSLPSLTARQLRTTLIVAGILGAGALRITAQASMWMIDHSRVTANDHRTKAEVGPLLGWEYTRMLEQTPERYGRVLFYGTTAHPLHATARTGLPYVHLGPLPDVMIRDRMEDDSPENLHRFNVRWKVYFEPTPSEPVPAGDIRVGPWHVHEIPDWDGKFARVERGEGEAITHRIDNDAVDVELKSTKPALVVLGMSYYPRWRAVDASGRAVPVYAYRATSKGGLDVVAAWVPPGTTRFTPDGPLPSDGKGRSLSMLALLGVLLAIVIWARPAWRYRVLRVLSRILQASRKHVPLASRIGSIVFAIGILAVGAAKCHAPVKHLELGTGALGGANVWVRPHGTTEWHKCAYSTLFGQYQCDEAVITDSTWCILNDEQPLWQYTTPTIYARSRTAQNFDLRIRMRRHLAGTYWAGTYGNSARIQIQGEPDQITNKQLTIPLADKGDREITVTVDVPGAEGFHLTFVDEKTLVPDRTVPRAPPTPP